MFADHDQPPVVFKCEGGAHIFNHPCTHCQCGKHVVHPPPGIEFKGTVRLSESPTHPDAPRAGGETPDPLARLQRTIARRYTRSRAFGYEPTTASVGLSDLESVLAELTRLRASGQRAEWHRRMSDEHCGTDEIVGYGPYHAEMLSDEALFLELGEEIFTVYFDKKKPCLNDGRAHRKGVLQMRYEETRARSAPPSPERASK